MLHTGATGFIVGGTAGIIRSATPLLFATASSIQTFTVGSTFWATRSGILQAWIPPNQEPTPSDLTKVSTAAGGITGGAIALLFRGRSNVIPGAVMFSLFGFLGQAAHDSYLARKAAPVLEAKVGFWRRMSEKPWSPVTVMTDDEYAELLRKKMMRVDVEIAILDDRIEALKKEQQVYDAEKAATAASTE